MHRAHIVARLRFYTADKSPRRQPILPPHFGCVLEIDHQAHECRLWLDSGRPIKPGDTVVLAILFLWPDLVLPKLSVGTKFFLWERGHIAEGEVLEILASN